MEIKLFRIPKKIWRKKTLFSSVSKIQARMRKLCHLFTRVKQRNTAKTHKTVTRDGSHNSSPYQRVDIDIYRARTYCINTHLFSWRQEILFGIGKTKHTWKVERECKAFSFPSGIPHSKAGINYGSRVWMLSCRHFFRHVPLARSLSLWIID